MTQKSKEELTEDQREKLDRYVRESLHYDERLQEWLWPRGAYIGQEIWNSETRSLWRWVGDSWEFVDPHVPDDVR